MNTYDPNRPHYGTQTTSNQPYLPNYQPYQQQYDQPPLPPQQPMFQPPMPSPKKNDWYKGNAGIIAMLLLFFPVGLFLMWKYARWPNAAKLVVTGIFVVLFVISAATNGNTANTNIAVQSQNNQQASVPQPTVAPTPTPKPLTAEQRILAVVQDHKGTDNHYLADLKTLQTTIILDAQWSAGTMKDSVKIYCFEMQQALWTTSPPLDLKTVVVTVKGDVVDQYGKESKEQVGYCSLGNETAAKFQWNNLTWKSAWGVYDNQGLAPFLQNA